MQLDDKQSIMDPTGTKELFKVSSNVGNTKQYCKFINRKGEAMNLVGKMTFSSSQGAIWVGQAPSKKKPDVQPVRRGRMMVHFSQTALDSCGFFCTPLPPVVPTLRTIALLSKKTAK